MSQQKILVTLDKLWLPDGSQATICALDEGRGLITVDADRIEYSSPSAALADWFNWLFGREESQEVTAH